MIRQKYECYEPVWRHRVIAEMHFGFIKSVGEDFRVTLGVIERKKLGLGDWKRRLCCEKNKWSINMKVMRFVPAAQSTSLVYLNY